MGEVSIYIFDTGPFIELKKYPKDIFQTFHANLESLIDRNRIKSCSEVLREIKRRDDDLAKWAKERKHIFELPNEDELKKVTEIFKKFPVYEDTLIKKKNIEIGAPEADIFVIAKALSLKATVVSMELFKINSGKIPNVCESLGVNHLSLFEFFRNEKWSF